MPDPQKAFLQMVLAGAILAVAAGLPAFILFLRRRPTPLLPPPDSWRVPWNGLAILFAYIVCILIASIMPAVLDALGFFTWMYGADFPTHLAPDDLKDPVRKQAANLTVLWGQAIALPIGVVIAIVGIVQGTRASLSQMGLSRERTGPNLVLGYLGWLTLTPGVLVIFIMVTVLLAANPDKHPLMDLGTLAGNREWLVFAIQAAILAPISEELLFRGLLLPWLLQPAAPDKLGHDLLVQPRHRPHLVYAAALLLPAISLTDAITGRQWDKLLPLPPTLLFLMALLPFYLVLPSAVRSFRCTALPSVQSMQAIFANSALFAAFHLSVWPTPVPLFFLSLGLGWLAIRTRSIVPCIVVHALFNGVAVLYVVLSGPIQN